MISILLLLKYQNFHVECKKCSPKKTINTILGNSFRKVVFIESKLKKFKILIEFALKLSFFLYPEPHEKIETIEF